MAKKYQALYQDKIFMGGADDIESIIENEGCEVIVDLRAEAQEPAFSNTNVDWVKVPLGDDATESQEELLQKAIDTVVTTYRNGKKVAFHCGGGKGRTGAVATGTLLSLGVSDSVEEAEKIAQEIRPVIKVKPAQKEALLKLFESNK